MGSRSIRHGGTVALFFIFLSVVLGSDSSVSDKAMRKLQDAFWEHLMQANPTVSTDQGVYAYNDQMKSYSLSVLQEQKNDVQAFTEQLTAIKRDDLNKIEQVNYDVLKDMLQTFMEGNTWAEYGPLTPIHFLEGIQLYNGPKMAPSATRGDLENYIARLYAVQTQIDEIIERCRRAIELKRTLHNVSLARVPQQIDRKLFAKPEDSSYYVQLEKKLNESHVQGDNERNSILQRGKEAVIAYMNAFRKLRSFIVDEYMPNTRTEHGVHAWDPTGDYYRACLKWHLSFDISPDAVHDTGLQEVDRISARMNATLAKLGFQGSMSEFYQSLEGDERFYTNDTDKILKEYNSIVFDRINPKLPTMFKSPPLAPFLIQPSPSDSVGGVYFRATDTSPGIFFVNLFRPMENKFFEFMSLALHEINPGHHLQQSYSLSGDLPNFRKYVIGSYLNVPSNYPIFTSYIEGWGLYSEYLGEEMGLYKDDYEMMGRYSLDMLRAVRLVVDSGIHYKKWTRQQALDYLMSHTSLGEGWAANEIDRYITLPGQACAYKLGEIKIKAIRAKAESELGDKFDIREFHGHVLTRGGLPMSLLESMTDSWIADMKKTTKKPTSSAGSVNNCVVQTLVSASVIFIWKSL